MKTDEKKINAANSYDEEMGIYAAFAKYEINVMYDLRELVDRSREKYFEGFKKGFKKSCPECSDEVIAECFEECYAECEAKHLTEAIQYLMAQGVPLGLLKKITGLSMGDILDIRASMGS
ncbi:MAG: hypothetical protein LBR22_02750 [Desulfovibrio sp.]|jgi:hypothetical protein|nr:hypothetical protein [Desulfovibrio sp.]